MGGTTLHAGILTQWFEMLFLLLFLKIRYYSQWNCIGFNATCVCVCVFAYYRTRFALCICCWITTLLLVNAYIR